MTHFYKVGKGDDEKLCISITADQFNTIDRAATDKDLETYRREAIKAGLVDAAPKKKRKR
ncbi:MAG: hypothetical protein ACR2RA_04975 [Geminicoccaceae bacterium]